MIILRDLPNRCCIAMVGCNDPSFSTLLLVMLCQSEAPHRASHLQRATLLGDLPVLASASLLKTNMASPKIPVFNRKFRQLVVFSIVMLVFEGVTKKVGPSRV